jgi:uncharacterized damage-inducible protein DinB
MQHRSHFPLLADYNRWMNRRLYAAAAQLPAEAVTADRGAFFGSILGTLNHLAVADTLWLKRFAAHPACVAVLMPMGHIALPARLDEPLFADLAGLHQYREWLDELIVSLAASLQESSFAQPLTYANSKGVQFTRDLHSLLVHFFNHQTHHRGQVTALLFQAGVDPGVTDLLALVPQIEQG